MSIRIISHRGASRIAPENTIAAATAALDRGAQVIELDVRESVDGVLYVMHDRKVDRTSDGSGRLETLTSHAIDELDAGSWFGAEFKGEPVPRLDAYLDFLKQRGAGAYVEIKWCNVETAVATLAKTAMTEAAFLFSFKAEMRAAMRTMAPHVRQCITLSLARNISVAKTHYNASLIELEIHECIPAVVDAARVCGMEVIAYTETDNEEEFRQLKNTGVDYINLDHIDVAVSVLGES